MKPIIIQTNTTLHSIQLTQNHDNNLNGIFIIIQYELQYYIAFLWGWSAHHNDFTISIRDNWEPLLNSPCIYTILSIPFHQTRAIFDWYDTQYTSNAYDSLENAKKDYLKLLLLTPAH